MATVRLPDDLQETVARALAEDIGPGDLTAQLVPADAGADATVSVRETAVLCGTAWFEEVFRQLDGRIQVRWDRQDGAELEPDSRVCTLSGPARGLLTGERTALNFLQTLSGTATVARAFARAVEGTRARILDTRKTLPGLRTAQKYAVRQGGCTNHRTGLFDAILIKENHILAAGSIKDAVRAARDASPDTPVEVEVENLDQLEEACQAKADRVLLDNFHLEGLREAVRRAAGRTELEASGGVKMENVREIAETGVDFISVGALTKHVRAADFSMRFSAER